MFTVDDRRTLLAAPLFDNSVHFFWTFSLKKYFFSHYDEHAVDSVSKKPLYYLVT